MASPDPPRGAVGEGHGVAPRPAHAGVVASGLTRRPPGAETPALTPPAQPKAPAGLPNGTYEYVFTKTEVKQLQAGPNLSPEEKAQVGGFNQEVRSVLKLNDDQWALALKFGNGDADDTARRLPTDGGTYTMKGNRIVMSNGHDDVSYRWALKNKVLGLTLLRGSLGADDARILGLALQHRFILTSKP